MRRLSIAIAAAFSLTAAGAYAGLPVLLLPDCNLITQDALVYVPQTFSGPLTLTSQTGNYGYRPGCGSFLADVKLAGYSNTEVGFGPQPLQYQAGPYDLPSSATTGGTIPIDAEDCARLTTNVSLWEKTSEAASFSAVCAYKETTSWNAASQTCSSVTQVLDGTCPAGLAPPPPNTTDWRTYRFAIRTGERTSTQEAAVTLSSRILTK